MLKSKSFSVTELSDDATRPYQSRDVFILDSQRGQCVNRAGHVEELGVGVDVGGQFGLGVAHRGLGGAERHARGAEVRAEGDTKGVNIHDAVSFVALGDTGHGQIAVEDAREARRNVKQRRGGGQAHRNRLRAAPRLVPHRPRGASRVAEATGRIDSRRSPSKKHLHPA